MGWWSQIWRKKAEDWIFGRLDASQAPAEALSGELDPEAGYLSVFLKSARVVDVRKGFRTFYGTVHSYIKLPHRSHGNAEFNVVTTPSALKNVDAGGIDRVIQLNHRLLGPVPYVGGDLEVEIGLFSVAASDLAAPYLELLENLSQKAGVAFVSAAVPFASPIIEGMKLLTGADKDIMLELGLSTTQSAPRLGYCVAIRAPKGTVDVKRLSVDPSDFRLLDNGRPLAQYPYFVLEFRADPERADWFQIPELAAGFRAVQEEFRAGRPARVDEALAVFRRTALTCNDLQLEDAERLVEKVEGTYQRLGRPKAARRGVRKVARRFPDLSEIGLYGD